MGVNRGSEWNKWDLHLHTASSYDYKYKGIDADDLLCDALVNNGIRAVAITDHFKIDKDRIINLRKIAPDIVFFPGVELRTDKGANNLHVILIFSEKCDLNVLTADFDAIMLRTKAKGVSSDDTIYWTFEDIVEFAKEKDALISIHAGRKTSGIDKEISNALPVKEAIKADIANCIQFFEIGQKRDVIDYEEHVFKEIERKPLIICSDNHNPKEYSIKETLWIKGDLTFEGLKQCVLQPTERVFIGVVPPVLDRLNSNKQSSIDRISIKRVDNPRNDTAHWFDMEMALNPGMVAIIGNKGTGKSALSDIIGHLCRCNTMNSASFLNSKRFRKTPKNYADDYVARIIWGDGEVVECSLGQEEYGTTMEDAQYLPQRFIEDICNNIDNDFQAEIDKVIFSYVDRSERGEAQNLQELVQKKSHPIELKVQADVSEIKELNTNIVILEKKQTEAYKQQISDGLKKAREVLARHDKSKPTEVKKPDFKETDKEFLEQLKRIDDGIELNRQKKVEISDRITKLNSLIDDVTAIMAKIELLESQFMVAKETVDAFATKYKIDPEKVKMGIITPKDYLDVIKKESIEKKDKLQETITNPENGLTKVIQELERQKEELVATANIEEKIYQNYLKNLEEWNERRVEIIGDKDTEGTLEFYSVEHDYIENSLLDEYSTAVAERDELIRTLYRDKADLLNIYQSIYSPIQDEITELLGDLEDNIVFKAELYMCNNDIAEKVLAFIDQRMSGVFGKSRINAVQRIEKLVASTDYNDPESVLSFAHKLAEAATENFEQADKKISNLQDFYDFIFSLDYVGATFKLKMGERTLNELSPGERGIILLMFYLALSKERMPIIIDQPEDNLDNQSVFNKLVPCICRAKQKRQVIIVTHNPNIAVACDAEQIVFCEMDKNALQIRYTAGAIENPEIKRHVVDVLEGTKPAFDLRSRKYN